MGFYKQKALEEMESAAFPLDEIKDFDQMDSLTEWEQDFIENIQESYRKNKDFVATPKQINVLGRWHEIPFGPLPKGYL